MSITMVEGNGLMSQAWRPCILEIIRSATIPPMIICTHQIDDERLPLVGLNSLLEIQSHVFTVYDTKVLVLYKGVFFSLIIY